MAVLLLVGAAIAFHTLRGYRAGGGVPRFYQENFGPAVMMACGYGFTAPSYASTPASLRAFLDLRQASFDCGDLPRPMPVERVTWNGTWYYLYGTTALVWRLTGITWTALDGLTAVFMAVTLAAYYGLFRLVAGRTASVLIALLIVLLPSNVIELSYMRDYSKVPFVLVALWLLAWLVMRPMRRTVTLAVAAVFGVVVGFGYGFRTDLMIMVPFGLAVITGLLPGRLREHWPRNLAAAGAAGGAFLIIAWLPLQGLSTGGCQFHYPLLGLTSPLTRELQLESPVYVFGDHFLDTFVDLKVGDYGPRMMGVPPPLLCAPEYDRASGDLFFHLARTFPADLVVRAYSSVLLVLQAGLVIPYVEGPLARIPMVSTALMWWKGQPKAAAALGLLITAAALGVAWAAEPRLGIAFTVFVLFLAGYPAIEFEARHWFHLRFLPWWSLLLVAGAVIRSWRNAGDLRVLWRAALPVAATVVAMASALVLVRGIQMRTASALIRSYLAAATEPLAVTARSGSAVKVNWVPSEVAAPPNHRGSDLLVVTIDSTGCDPAGPLDVRIRYDADGPSHDMGNLVTVARGMPGSAPTHLFVPIFSLGLENHSYLRFAAVEVPDRSADCIASVARIADRTASPVWVQVQAPPDWTEQPLYQRMRVPHMLSFRR